MSDELTIEVPTDDEPLVEDESSDVNVVVNNVTPEDNSSDGIAPETILSAAPDITALALAVGESLGAMEALSSRIDDVNARVTSLEDAATAIATVANETSDALTDTATTITAETSDADETTQEAFEEIKDNPPGKTHWFFRGRGEDVI